MIKRNLDAVLIKMETEIEEYFYSSENGVMSTKMKHGSVLGVKTEQSENR